MDEKLSTLIVDKWQKIVDNSKKIVDKLWITQSLKKVIHRFKYLKNNNVFKLKMYKYSKI